MRDSGRTVLVVSNMYPSARSERFGSFVADACRSLRDSGWQVRLAVSDDPRRGAVRNLWKYAVLTLRTFGQIVRGGYDAVHAHYLFPPAVLGAIAARARGVPLLAYSHGSDVLFAGARWPVGPLTRWAVGRADIVAVPTGEHGRQVRERFGLSAEKVVEIPIGVDTTRFARGGREQARRLLGLDDDATLALFIGALDDNKGEGLEDLVRAIAHPDVGGVAVVAIGEGPRRERIEALARESGVDGRVTLLPWQDRDRIRAWLQAADVVVVASRRESLGLVALEARAVGTPVVATNVGGLPEHVEPGESGELYEPGDIEGLVGAVRCVLEARRTGGYPVSFDEQRWGLSGTGCRLAETTSRLLELRKDR